MPPAPATPNDSIVIRGARTHNLKSIDVEIPHNALTVVSGVSGSGKSSLAFDTVYAEGQRRYVESLSAYARQFLERIEKPDVDHIEGLAPAIAIRQKNQTRNPRSTVATSTEIHDYLRLLYARCGIVHCLDCNGVVKQDTVDEVAAAVSMLPEGTRLYALFPVERRPLPAAFVTEAAPEAANPKPRGRKPKHPAPVADPASIATDALRQRLADLRSRGFTRLYQPAESSTPSKLVEFSTPESLLALDFTRPIFVLADRISISADIRGRIVDAVETAYRESGEILFETLPRPEDSTPPRTVRYSAAFECSACHRAYREPEPRLFSFNNPYGACPRCQGFGNTVDFDPDLIIPDKSKTLDQSAIDPWARLKYRPMHGEMKRAAKSAGVPLDVPWCDLKSEHQAFIWNGNAAWPGIRGFFAFLERKKYKLHVRVFLSKYRGYAQCPECLGARLRPEARAVTVGGLNICQASAHTVADAHKFFSELTLSPMQAEIAAKVLDEVRQRLGFLHEVGLDYLTLDRLSSTLSGGESQRIQLATSLGSRLVGALYVLDEPSIGLHPRDTDRLIRILRELRDLGNTVLVVEHDPDVLRSADHLLDLGPGAGELGGKLLAAGTVKQVSADPASITGKYLSGRVSIPVPKRRRTPGRDALKLIGAHANNLHNLDAEIPLNLLVAVTGVSGSGKSTLVHQILHRALLHSMGRTEGADPSGLYTSLTGAQMLNDVVLIDQSPIGRTPRSNPVTYIKAFDAIRTLFSQQPDARRRGYSAGNFSFNVPGGRCDACEGDGTVTVEMQFLADVELPCEDCGGTRYKPGILDVRYKDKNIHDVLNLTVREALRFFAGHPRITDRLSVLDEIGLGYVRLGQSATTLSGGEAQRVKLASHLAAVRATPTHGEARRPLSRVLYLLDEPTTGLHFDDVGKLLVCLNKLVNGGGSVLVIEHNLDVIKSADWVLDLGPEGGVHGGMMVATGTPEQIAATPNSHTGRWLRPLLQSV